ncbi:MAG: hypothetical protein AAF517_15190, partial [Planctomycetota bacterium]
MKSSILRWYALMFWFVLASGCATLEIDVDVYKGPLVMEPEVQMQELAILPIAAKPLLIDVREKLESNKGCECRGIEARRGECECLKRKHPNCVADEWLRFEGFVPNEGRTCYEDEGAARLNAVLQLYENAPYLPTAVLRDWYSRVLLLSRRYDREWARFTDTRLTRRVLASIPEKIEGDDALMEIRTRMRSDYDRILADSFRETGNLFDAGPSKKPGSHTLLSDLGEARPAECPIEPLSYKSLFPHGIETTSESGERQPYSSFTRQIDALGRPTVLRCHARILFGTAYSKEAVEFMRTMSRLSASFAAARAAIDEIFSTTLTTIEKTEEDATCLKMNSPRAEDGDSSSPHQTCSVCPMSKANAACSHTVIERYVHDLFEFAWSLVRVDAFQSALRSSSNPLESSNADDRRSNLIQRLEQKPTRPIAYTPGFARELKSIHDQFKQTAPEAFRSSGQNDDLEWSEDARRRYGITIGPKELEPVQRQALLDSAVGAAGLDRGRLAEGLELLIEDYLELGAASPEGCGDHDRGDLCIARRRLLDALVRFSAKLRFLGDHGRLLNDGVADEVLILDAAANSIGVLANEQLRYSAFQERQTDARDVEVLAVFDAWDSDPQSVAGRAQRPSKSQTRPGASTQSPSSTSSSPRLADVRDVLDAMRA